MTRTLLLVAIVALVTPQFVAAQGAGGTRAVAYPQQNTMAQAIYWITTEQMQKELEIIPEQKEKLDKIRNEMQAKTQEAYKTINLKELKPEEYNAKYYEVINKVSEETAKKVEEVLLPHQVKRLKQIMTQTRLASLGYGWGGAAALGADDLAKELGITDEQREQLKKKEEEVRAEVQQKSAEFYKKLQEESREKIFSVLTPTQRKKLEELQGDRFEWKTQQAGAVTKPVEKPEEKKP